MRAQETSPLPSSSQVSVQTTLRCLVCGRPVCRFVASADGDEDKRDLRKVDYALDEAHTLLIVDGWLQISQNDCLDSPAMKKAMASPSWSSRFSIVLPEPSQTHLNNTTPPSTEPVLPRLPPSDPLFLPPPFSPADPAFLHLSTFAQEQSDSARAKAQGELDAFTIQKLSEIKELDKSLRHEVDMLWSKWRDAWHQHVDPTISGQATPDTPEARKPQTRPRKSEPIVTIKDDFDSIPSSPITQTPQYQRQPTSPPPVYGSLLTNSRIPAMEGGLNSPYEPSSRSRSPRQLLARLDSADSSRFNTSPAQGTPNASGSRSPLPLSQGGRLLVESTGPLDESRAVAASFQIMMSDSMAPARAAYLSKLGVSSTYEGDEKEESGGLALADIMDSEPSVAPPLTPQQPRTPSRKTTASPKSPKSPTNGRKTVTFGPDPVPLSPKSASTRPVINPTRSNEFPIFELDMNLQDEPNAIDESPRRPPVERSRSSDVFDSVARPRVWKRQSSQTSPGHGLSTSVSRPGFIGSLPADAQLAKLAIGPHSILEKENGGSSSVDWKEAAREQVRDEDEKYAEIERLAGLEEEESSPGDSVPALPIMPRRRQVSSDGIASSLPISIQGKRPFQEKPNFMLAPKTSLIDRPGVFSLAMLANLHSRTSILHWEKKQSGGIELSEQPRVRQANEVNSTQVVVSRVVPQVITLSPQNATSSDSHLSPPASAKQRFGAEAETPPKIPPLRIPAVLDIT